MHQDAEVDGLEQAIIAGTLYKCRQSVLQQSLAVVELLLVANIDLMDDSCRDGSQLVIPPEGAIVVRQAAVQTGHSCFPQLGVRRGPGSER